MFNDNDRRKLDMILGKITDLTETNVAILTGVASLNVGIGALNELTLQLVDAVAGEEAGDLAEEIAKLEAAIAGLTGTAAEIGRAITSKIDDIAMENGFAVPATAC